MSSDLDSRQATHGAPAHHSGQAPEEGSAETNPTVSYEPQDVNPTSVFKFLVALSLAVLASMLIVSGIYRALVARESPSAGYPWPLRPQIILPPEPRLQGAPGHRMDPREEQQQARAEAEATLRSYAWVDEKAGIARIPVAEAMKLLSQRGLPARAGVPRAATPSAAAKAPTRAAVPRGRKKQEKQP